MAAFMFRKNSAEIFGPGSFVRDQGREMEGEIGKAASERKLDMPLDDIIAQSDENATGGRFPKERKFSPRNSTNGSKPSYPYFKNKWSYDPKTVTNRVYVGNLAYRTVWQTLKDHFKPCGEVIYADVLLEDGGRSKVKQYSSSSIAEYIRDAGMCELCLLSLQIRIVEFRTKEEAIKAIETMNDSLLDGRAIFVREDREDKKATHHRHGRNHLFTSY
jgi:hypothetical protein